MTKDEEFWKELDRVYSGVIKYEVIRKHPLFQRIKVNQDKVCGNAVRIPAKPGVTIPLKTVHIHFEIPEVYVEKYDKHMVMTQITEHINLAIQNGINTMQIIWIFSIKLIILIMLYILLYIMYYLNLCCIILYIKDKNCQKSNKRI